MEDVNQFFEGETSQSGQFDYEYDEQVFFREPTMEFLNNVDYSLNSPLIIDEIEGFIKYIRTGEIEARWEEKIWKKRKFDFLEYMKIQGIMPAKTFYHWFGKINLKEYKNDLFMNFLKDVEFDAKITFGVVKAFMKGWLNKTIDYQSKLINDTQVLNWGSMFMDLHKITTYLNATSNYEISRICEDMKECSIDENGVKKYESSIFGLIILSNGFLYFTNHGRILDRNTLLMMKDCYVARFQTCFSLYNRVDHRYNQKSVQLIKSLYRTGDEIFSKLGETGFDAIKLLEPTCNLQLTKLAHAYRPFIPDFPNFELHVKKGHDRLSRLSTSCKKFFNLITDTKSVYDVLILYSSFRHWGHPYINYKAGLIKLHHQVTMPKSIDKDYVQALASDLAFKVLQKKFMETKTWFVEINQLEDNHFLFEIIRENIWPTPDLIAKFGDHWHELPLKKCFDVPDVIDPTLIYSDKSHSMTRSEVISFMKANPNKPIPSKKVLTTLLEKEATNWPKFLKEVNENGLDENDLIIGLKAKEREIKPDGRFFSLMSWRLRDYFVFTEYLIKTHFVPLFYELTMADDLTTVMKKMMENASGQGLDSYDEITIANHIDYEKWNNHQRKESNGPIFKVMGQFLGYPNLFLRTHEFFESSLIYYNMRGDLLKVHQNKIVNKTSQLMCWNGQFGGLEGLRQKGWSVVNLLVVNRESQYRNTFIKCLIQGDNQVICMQYKLRKTRDENELIMNLNAIVQNNNVILSNIERGTTKLGLIINKDETMQSADYLNYGKVPVFRGNILGLETKRWSRVTCVTNDQMPTLANIMSTVTSNALTVSHFSTSPINPICHLNFLGNFVRKLIEIHNPALRQSMNSALKNESLQSLSYKIGSLYLDPSIGGICGCSLTRFLMRLFPDPVTESLSFLKLVHDNTDDKFIKELMISFGHPKLVVYNETHLSKLIEDPLSLNIPKGISATTMLKNEIRKSLVLNSGKIRNKIIKDVTKNYQSESARLLSFLGSIKPKFPRFLSEFKSATYIGLTDSLISLFQNSKTIRTMFSYRLRKELDHIIVKSEIIGLSTLFRHSKKQLIQPQMWSCSSTRADHLRFLSWSSKIVGATVPHPLELLNRSCLIDPHCRHCFTNYPNNLYVSTLIPSGLDPHHFKRGPYPAYLGSKTSESTSILQPWERETKVPLIQRASKLRSAIGWFVEPDSALAKSIYANLHALTGEDWSNSVEGFKRTGSALHRFSCSRQSAGGFIATSPIKSTYMISTTNTLSELGDQNYDFIFQTLLLYTEITCGEFHAGNHNPGYYHMHISCTGCLRTIDEPTLNTTTVAIYRDVHNILDSWKPENTDWSIEKRLHKLPQGNWDSLSDQMKSYHIGRGEGFLFGELTLTNSKHADDSSIFPLSLVGKVCPCHYLDGILSGFIHAGILNTIYRRSVISAKRLKETGIGTVIYLIDRLSKNPNMINIWRSEIFELAFRTIPHRIPVSYPTSNTDFGTLGRNYLKYKYIRLKFMTPGFNMLDPDLWIFSDLNNIQVVSLMLIGAKLISLIGTGIFSKTNLNLVRELRNAISNIRINEFELTEEMQKYLGNGRRVASEIRHACKGMTVPSSIRILFENYNVQNDWTDELIVKSFIMPIFFEPHTVNKNEEINVKRKQDPLISGLRQFQFATGAHYKLRSILKEIKLPMKDALIGGDGSGGISSCFLRLYPSSRIIFNSLLNFEDVQLKGSNPSPPSAIMGLKFARNRCVNLQTVWQFPSDLSSVETWKYFVTEKERHQLDLNVLIFDMEVQNLCIANKIEENITQFVFKLCSNSFVLIYKTYVGYLLDEDVSCLKRFGSIFEKIDFAYTEVTSSHSSEIYVICYDKKQSQLQSIHPNYQILYSHLQSHPCFQNELSEFKRALSLKKYDFLQGVPKDQISDPFLDLSSILTNLGVFTGLAYELSSQLKTSKRDSTDSLYLFIVSLNSILTITEGSDVPKSMPSDTIVQNLGILIVGFFIWYSYVRVDFELKSIIQKFIDFHFTFNWLTSDEHFGYYTHCWSPIIQYKLQKRLHLDDKMATIGQVIRILSRIFPNTLTKPDLKTVNIRLKLHNRNLNLRFFNQITGLFTRFDDLQILTHLKPTLPDINIPNQSVSPAWQS
ncbi:RNA-dependent RNA polymerase [Bactrocera dorsalis sigmavirus]|uniref:Replicase n=1 Tax=Bactrocera dorsalis sigmavirus TaxID=2760896 RepID=A0A7G4YW82_9RHAB|nr:RNA-dependent RNA polymerase [Bactrocera dorsalis sigmavirus]